MNRIWVAALALLLGICIGGGIEYTTATRHCDDAIQAADDALYTAGAAFEVSANGLAASADDDLVGLLDYSMKMSDLQQPMSDHLDDYLEAKQKCL